MSLNISKNINLTDLSCRQNQLTQLDVSANKVLTNFYCDNNQITSLNVSSNAVLYDFRCNDNQLTSLNGKNGNPRHFWLFYAYHNPNLTCVQVDDVAYSTSNWYWTIDSSASFSETCTVGIDNIAKTEVNIFPNPSFGKFTIDGLPLEGANIDIYNVLGEKVYSRNSKQTLYTIDISNSPKGMYFVKISDGKKIKTNKIEIR
jgi:Leucine-rich repeat (LRR) protein